MTYDIRWQPLVCECIILQDRNDPDNLFEFEKKCELHKDLEDIDARSAIIQLCIEEQQ